MHELLQSVSHRPWPLPRGPWIMRQTWHDLLFAHWPVKADHLRPLLPPGVELDLHSGEAWLSVIPFHMTGIGLRGFPDLPGFSAFPEVNVRTYVTRDGKPGVYFLSLDATHAAAMWVARAWYHLRYLRADISVALGEKEVRYSCLRLEGPRPAELCAAYAPVAEAQPAAPGSLEHWLTERYCLYSLDRNRRLYRAQIHHLPWRLQPAEAEFELNTMALSHRIPLPDTRPLLHFSRRMETLVWPPELVS